MHRWMAWGLAWPVAFAGPTTQASESGVARTSRTLQQLLACACRKPSSEGEQVCTCIFLAPSSCKIVSATATPIGGPPIESLTVAFAQDGTRMTSAVILRGPTRLAAVRSTSPQVSITAQLECLE